jgi:DNA-binding beta-propeller fold protein YncE
MPTLLRIAAVINFKPGKVSHVCSHPNGTLLLSIPERKEVVVYDYYQQKVVSLFAKGKHYCPSACAVDPNGRVYVAEKASVRIFNPDGSYVRTLLLGEKPLCLAVNSTKLYVGCHDYILVFLTSTWRRSTDITAYAHIITSVALLSTGVVVFSSDALYSFDETTRFYSNPLSVYEYSGGIAIDAADRIYVIDKAKETICVCAETTKSLIKGLPTGLVCICVTADNDVVVLHKCGQLCVLGES